MRHTFACPLRWADMDALGHVNNVVYVDYLREARLALTTAPDRVLALEIDYEAPLVFRPEPVLVESRIDGDGVLVQEIADRQEDGGRTVYAKARTTFVRDSVVPRVRPDPALAAHVPVTVRARDLGSDGYVDEVATLELFQESRIVFLQGLVARQEPRVVRRTAVTYLCPYGRGAAAYAVHHGIGRVGRSSFEIRAELVDEGAEGTGGPVVVASSRTVIVAVDAQSRRPRSLTEHERAHLEPHVVSG